LPSGRGSTRWRPGVLVVRGQNSSHRDLVDIFAANKKPPGVARAACESHEPHRLCLLRATVQSGPAVCFGFIALPDSVSAEIPSALLLTVELAFVVVRKPSAAVEHHGMSTLRAGE